MSTQHIAIPVSEGTASAVRICKLIPVASRVEPTRHLYQGKEYTRADQMVVRLPVEHYSKPRQS